MLVKTPLATRGSNTFASFSPHKPQKPDAARIDKTITASAKRARPLRSDDMLKNTKSDNS